MIIMVEGCLHEFKISKVSWQPPANDVVKLNIDGNIIGNPGSIGIGGICRNSQGNLLIAF